MHRKSRFVLFIGDVHASTKASTACTPRPSSAERRNSSRTKTAIERGVEKTQASPGHANWTKHVRASGLLLQFDTVCKGFTYAHAHRYSTEDFAVVTRRSCMQDGIERSSTCITLRCSDMSVNARHARHTTTRPMSNLLYDRPQRCRFREQKA